MNTEVELKPCKCGETLVVYIPEFSHEADGYFCNRCNSFYPTDTIELWNRHMPPRVQGLVDALEMIVDEDSFVDWRDGQ